MAEPFTLLLLRDHYRLIDMLKILLKKYLILVHEKIDV
jgi:hypothetical protein